MTQTDLLTLLQQNYPDGADSGTMDVAALQNTSYTALFTQLGISSTAIPLNNSAGFTTQGTGILFKGSVNGTFLGLTNPAVTIQFTPDLANSGAFVMLIHLNLPANWTFGQSIPFFTGGIYDALVLDMSVAPALILASGQATDPVNNANTTTPDIYFYGLISNTQGPVSFTLALALLDAFTAETTVFGPIGLNMTVPGQETINMNLVVGNGTISNLFGSDSVSLSLTLSLFAGQLPGITQYQSGVQFAATVTFGSDNITLSALLTGQSDGLLNLEITGTALAIDANAISTYFGSNNGILSSLPPQFQDSGTSLIAISAINFGIGLTSKTLEYAMMTITALEGQLWNVWMDGSTPVISIGNLSFTFSIFQPFGTTPTYEFNFAGIFELGGVVPILIQAQLGNASDLILSGQLPVGEQPGVAALVAAFYPGQTSIPSDLVFEVINFEADITAGMYSAGMTIAGDWEFEFGDNGTIAFEELSLSFEYDSASSPTVQAGIQGKFSIDETNQFDISLEISDTNFTFDGTWQDTGKPITYIDIVMALGMYGLPALPDIDLDLTGAELTFDSQNLIFSFELDSKSFGDAIIVAGKSTAGSWGFIFGLEGAPKGQPINIDLGNIPVVGNLVPSGDDVLSITNLRFVGATTNLPAITLTTRQQAILGTQVSSGITLSIDFSVGTLVQESFTVRFALNDGSAYDTPPPPSQQQSQSAVAAVPSDNLPSTASTGSLATWVNVQRTFGPVQINRVGFQVSGSNVLGLLLDAGVSLGGLSIGLTALEVTIPISSPYVPGFSLGGLEVAYTGTDFTIQGGLLAVPGQSPAEYTGNLTVQAGPFGATAFGMYTTVSGQPSLFAYLAVTAPLGGPPFFFVTGLAGGFGYNAQISLPTIDTVSTYPLIQAVTQVPPQSASQVQAALQSLVSPQVNENWLAAGIKFTSFEMLNSFALLTVAFGNNFSVALMGESTITVPLSVPGETQQPAIAQAQMTILIEFLPSQGVFAVNAQLSPASYVLNQNAHITGGFAFYLWFDPSPYAGDFVVTLGGYNPYFVPQPYYPSVPRLGISWQISTDMSITGGVYFALTPSAIMAGGSLSAVYHTNSLRAWFNAEADFLMRFKPFAYEISISVTVGASVTLDLLVTTKTITISVGVGLQLWGPPFGGSARIDLSIISFTIDFGADLDKPSGLTWDVFTASFLPPPQSTPPAGSGGTQQLPRSFDESDVPTTTTDSIISLSATTGLIQTIDANTWQVDPETFALLVTLQIPTTTASVNTTDEHNSPVNTPVPGSWNTSIGVGPMGIAVGDLTVVLTIDIAAPGAGDEDVWVSQAVTGSLPKGMWENTTNQMSTDGTISDALVGVSLVPTPPAPATTAAIALNLLLFNPANPVSWEWSNPTIATTDQYGSDDPMTTLESSLVDTTVAATRSSWITSLNAQGFNLNPNVNVSNFAANANNLLLSPPALRLAGEEKAESA